MKRLTGVVLAVGLAALAVACARPYYLAPDAPPGRDLATLLVLPFNFDQTPPASWVDGLGRLSEQVAAYLTSTGRRVEPVGLAEVLSVWQEAVESVGGMLDPAGRFDPGRYEAARAQLARRLAAGRGADAVVLPSVISRLAASDGGLEGRSQLKWDGVVRPVPLEIRDPGSQPERISGSFKASSLRVTVFDPRGERLFERVRGLEPLEVVRIDGSKVSYADRTDLFQDEALLEEEVRVVFEPLIEAR